MSSTPLSLAKTTLHVLDQFLGRAPRFPLIVILGPTASGKTAFSLRVARYLASAKKTPEIVNADSRQLYRGLDIGTAKITEAEMSGVSHHLLSVLEPTERCTIAWYQRAASGAIDAIRERGNLPMLVGGSMLYVSAVIDGLRPLPPADRRLHDRLTKAYDVDRGRTLHERLSNADPESAAAIPRQNKAHLIRALEIFEQTGEPKSQQLRRVVPPYELLIFGMNVPRERLKERIRRRTEQLFRSGWIDEVRALKEQGVGRADPAMVSTGYREILRCLENGLNPLQSLNKIVVQTCQYAKRQMMWWRRDRRIHWVSGGGLDAPDQR